MWCNNCNNESDANGLCTACIKKMKRELLSNIEDLVKTKSKEEVLKELDYLKIMG